VRTSTLKEIVSFLREEKLYNLAYQENKMQHNFDIWLAELGGELSERNARFHSNDEIFNNNEKE